jgi:hypothetical protein
VTLLDAAGAVDVALHDVAAEPVRDAHRPLQVDRAAGPDVAERAAAQRLGHDVGGEGVVRAADHGEAHAVDRDGVAVLGVAGHERSPHGEPGGVLQGLDGHDLPELLDDAGEHFRRS